MKSVTGIPLGQFLAGIFWMGIAILVLYGIRTLPAADPGGLGPATFPKILAVSLVGLVAIYGYQSRKGSQVEAVEDEVSGSVIKASALSVLALASALLWELVGALPILIALSIIELKWIEGFTWPRVLGVGLTLSVGMWVIFTQLLGVSLPLGLLIWFY
jgi:hypothetical protein